MRTVQLAVAIATTVFAVRAHAVVIDQFDGSMSLDRREGTFIGPGILGDERETYTIFFGKDGAVLEIDAMGSSALHLANPDDGLPEGSIVLGVHWDGVDVDNEPPGLGGVDLTEGGTHNALAIRVLSLDVPPPFPSEYRLSFKDTSGTITGFDGALAGLIVSPQTLYVPFSSINPEGDFSFSSVDSIAVLIATPGNSELQIDWIGTALVPEPSSIVLGAMGLIALAAFGRYRNRRSPAPQSMRCP